MHERLTTLVLALGALALFVTLFVRGEAPDARSVSLPTSIDRADNGLAGALIWLREESVRTLSLRQRFGSLTKRSDLPRAGNLLIVTMPAATTFRNDEAVALDQWIRDGNTALVLAAISDRPAWGRDRGVLASDLQLLTGLEIELVHTRETSVPRKAAGRGASPVQEAQPAHESEGPAEKLLEATRLLPQPLRGTLVPNRAQRYLDAVKEAYSFSDYSPRTWDLKIPRDAFPIALAHSRETGQAVLWMMPDGSGTILVSAYGSLFSNRALGQADNARLLANIVKDSVSPDGVVLFDDEHQGLSDTYDPAMFFRDRRLYMTLGIIAAVWLAWVLGGTKLHMPPAPAPAPREEDLVRSTGMFLARVLRPAAVARRMFENFFLRLHRSTHSAAHDPTSAWDWLESNPRLARTDVVQLKEWYANAYSERRVPLSQLHNLIVKTERQLAA